MPFWRKTKSKALIEDRTTFGERVFGLFLLQSSEICKRELYIRYCRLIQYVSDNWYSKLQNLILES